MTLKSKRSRHLNILKDYGFDILLFLIAVLFLLYISMLGTGYSQLFPEIVIPTFVLIILVYMFEGAPEGDIVLARDLRKRLRKWGRRAVMGCVLGVLCFFAGPLIVLPRVWFVPSFSFNPMSIGYLVGGCAFLGFVIYWMHITRLAEAIPVATPSAQVASEGEYHVHTPQ